MPDMTKVDHIERTLGQDDDHHPQGHGRYGRYANLMGNFQSRRGQYVTMDYLDDTQPASPLLI